MYSAENEKTFQELLEKFKNDKELFQLLEKVGYEDLFSYEFLALNSDFSSLDDIMFRSGFGIMSPLEINNIPLEKWDEYIDKHTEKCSKWHEFGKLAMIFWMQKQLKNK